MLVSTLINTEYMEESSSKKKILIIEDNIETQLMFKVYLRKNYDVQTASSAEEGIDKLKSDKYDLLILDINLQGEKDGNDVLREIRYKLNMKNFPIIIVSAFALKGDKENFLYNGANDYLAKPVQKAMLLDKIRNFA